MRAAFGDSCADSSMFGNVYKALSWPGTEKQLRSYCFSPPYCHSLTLSTLLHPLLVASQSQSHLSRIYLEPIVTLRDRGLPSSLFPLITHKDRGLPSSLPFTHSHQRPSVITVAYGQEHLVSALVHSLTNPRSEAFRRLCYYSLQSGTVD